MTAALGPRPANHLVWAVLATLFCCLPGGIVAIVYAAQVDAKYDGGDAAGARRSADNARLWCWISFWTLLLPLMAILALWLLGMSAAVLGSLA